MLGEAVKQDLTAVNEQLDQCIDQIAMMWLPCGAETVPEVHSETGKYIQSLRAVHEVVATRAQLAHEVQHMPVGQSAWRSHRVREHCQHQMTVRLEHIFQDPVVASASECSETEKTKTAAGTTKEMSLQVRLFSRREAKIIIAYPIIGICHETRLNTPI
jgi:hypothetical protein